MRPATTPRLGPAGARLIVVDPAGHISHRRAVELPLLVDAGDLVVANDAATMPASLPAIHARTGAAVEVRLAGRASLAPETATFTAVMFGAGDFRTATEDRRPPPAMHVGDALVVGPLRAVISAMHHPRLVDLRFDQPAARFWDTLARHGRPIQYSYVREPLDIWHTWTSIASQPVAFEPPSAGFVLDWGLQRALRARGAGFATLTHAAGISSTGDAEIDRQLPFDEPYRIPGSTAMRVSDTRHHGRRVIAIGTTVVRALEDSARRHGRVVAGESVATGRLGADRTVSIVDTIVSGMHEPGTSHYELLRAFQCDAVLADLTREADGHGYESHEFGDLMLLAKSAHASLGHTSAGQSVGQRVKERVDGRDVPALRDEFEHGRVDRVDA